MANDKTIETLRKAVSKAKQKDIENGTVVRFRVLFEGGTHHYTYLATYIDTNVMGRAGWFVSGSRVASISGYKSKQAFVNLLANEHGQNFTVTDSEVAAKWDKI